MTSCVVSRNRFWVLEDGGNNKDGVNDSIDEQQKTTSPILPVTQ